MKKTDGHSKVYEDQNHGKAEATEFHCDTSEQEVAQLLRKTVTEIGMSTKYAKIECPAKLTTHAFIYFKGKDERNKYVKSANMLRRGLIAEGRFHHKRLGFFKCCIHTRHSIPLNSISLNWISKYVSVYGQIAVRACQSGSLKYQDIESEVQDQMEKWLAKNSSQRL